MTIAWKLFYFRTSPHTRSSTLRQQQHQQEQGEEENHDAVSDFRRRDRDRDRDAAVRGPFRPRPQQGKVAPSPPPRHPLRRAAGQRERESVVSEKRRTSEHGARNSSKSGLANCCTGRTFNGRLPGSVMEARARLTERLKSCHLAESGPKDAATEVSLDTHEFVELATGDSGNQHLGTAPGLPEETFHDAGEMEGAAKAPAECSICLERFLEGEELVRLHCGHRFHHACLEPWFQAHGVCPYCRAGA